jgi:hypothetical protein
VPESDLENQIDELYKRAVAEFVAARDELSRSLKKAGDADAAARIKALEKPGLSSWAVNHLYWNARRDWDALTSAGGRLRSAQRRGVADQLREAVRERRPAMSVLLKQAEAALEAGGHVANPQTMGRISGTLEAIAAKGTFEAAGRLSHDLQAPGFEALSGLALVKPSAAKPRAAAVAAGQGHAAPSAEREADDHAARLEAAQFELRDRRRTAEGAAAARDVAVRRLEAAQAEESEAKRRLQRAGEVVREASTAAERARQEARQAAAALAKAERALEDLKHRKTRSHD